MKLSKKGGRFREPAPTEEGEGLQEKIWREQAQGVKFVPAGEVRREYRSEQGG